MKLKQLFADDNAVSPVIGVILMVAITVILAAVIGTFVLGLGDRVSEAQPNAQFTFEYAEDAGDLDTADTTADSAVNITHDGGDGVEGAQLEVSIGGSTVWDNGANGAYETNSDNWQDSKLTAGSTVEVLDGGNTISDGQEVKVIWTASGSDKTAVIAESEVAF